MTRPDPRWVAFQAGFNISGERYNGELNDMDTKRHKRWLRQQFTKWLKTQPKKRCNCTGLSHRANCPFNPGVL